MCACKNKEKKYNYRTKPRNDSDSTLSNMNLKIIMINVKGTSENVYRLLFGSGRRKKGCVFKYLLYYQVLTLVF